ncbi:hypothetical protein GYMLUDRAFT_547718 [Collybiopsis luxurians FD-317 M1]|nr:hypothetical protein GYMLUDRAFT_547718 [Collybiopsis luxurians FD-317 M1]
MAQANQPADPAIQDFVNNPVDFLTVRSDWGEVVTVSSYKMFPGLVRQIPGGRYPQSGYFKFVLDYEDLLKLVRTYEIKFAALTSGPNLVQAYNLGYNGGAQVLPYPAFLDIPKNPTSTDPTLLFTGSLSGCSVICTNLDANTYRVYHDARMESSLLYDNVVMAIDYSGYNMGSSGLACVFMQYQAGQWQMYVLPQAFANDQGGMARIVARNTGAKYGLETVPSNVMQIQPYNAQQARTRFDSWRNTTQDMLQQIASRVLGDANVPNEPNGDFEPFTNIVLSNPAVKHTRAIRDAILKAAGTSLQERETRLLDDSRDLDYVYLWLQQKQAQGIAAVVKTDLERRASAGNTAGERITDQQLNALLSGNEDFATGYDTYDQVEIPGYASDMTLLDMVTLFDETTNLTQTQRGALIHRIRDADEAAFKTSVWEQTDKIVGMFQDSGGSTKPMPQDLILNAVPDEFGGRCYPLVRAMSVALAQSDFAVDQLGIKLIALTPSSTTDLNSAELFRRCLQDLHASFPAVEASKLIGTTNLQDAVNRLSADTGKSTIFALNTDIHAMLLGVTNRGGKTSYHFYDPNFAIASFDSQAQLLNATTKFFTDTDYQYANVYAAGGTASDPTFTLVQLDTDKMAGIGFDYRLTVADFCEPETLTETVSIKAAINIPDPNRFTTNRGLSAGATLLEAAELGEQWRLATEKLEASTGLGEHWTPILETIEDVDSGGYRIQFVNIENPDDTRWVNTDDPQIKEFKEYLDEHLQALNKAYEFENGTFVRKENIPDADAIDALNAMFLVKTLIEHFSGRKDDSQDEPTNRNLAISLEIQSYLNLTQLGQQSLSDVAKLVELTQTIIRSEQAAQSSLSTVVRAFGRVSEGAGLVLGAANVVFDAYELSNAENEIEKGVFGTQLAFDSASFLAGVGSIGAGMVGASSAAAVLGGVGVILGGLAIGFGALAEAFGRNAQGAAAVGKYFGDMDAAYKAGGYKYDPTNKVLIPLPGAVIAVVNLSGNVQFDTQYLYRTEERGAGSGSIDWTLVMPKMILDRTQAVDIRSGIGAPATGTLVQTSNYTTFILPATPKAYIRYEWNLLPGATTRHDYGFSVLRKLEEGKQFDFDFYSFPGEFIVRRIWFEYVETPVVVNLDAGTNIRIQAPSLPDIMYNVLQYTLQGSGSDYTIGLMAGVGFTLSSTNNSTRWILDCRDLTGGNTIIVGDSSVSVGGVQVKIADQNFQPMLAIRTSTANATEMLQIDFANHSASIIEEDASQFPGGSDAILAYLNDLNDQQVLHGSFIIVDNYTTSSGKAVGRAFYDITGKRMLYTVNAPTDLTTNVQLGALGAFSGRYEDYTYKDEVYFYNLEHSAIWRVDADTGDCLAKYNAFFPSANRTFSRFWQEDVHVFAVFRHSLGNNKFGELCYVLQTDSIKLVSIFNDSDLLQKLNTLDKWDQPPSQLLAAYNVANPSPSETDGMDGANFQAEIESFMLSVFGHDLNDVYYRFWIRLSDGVIIKPNFSPPVDLVLAGTITPPGGNVEEYCFYSLTDQTITLQNGSGSKANQPVPVNVPSEFGKLSNVFCVDNKLFAITASGYVLRITSQGELFLEAVNREWFAQFKSGTQGPWWTVLKSFAESHGANTVAILGLHVNDVTHHTVPAWFSHGKFVLFSSDFHHEQLQLAGLVDDGNAWVCVWEKGKMGRLYSQPIVSDDQLATYLNPTDPILVSTTFPAPTEILESDPFQSVVVTRNGLQYTTTDGVIFLVANKDNIKLYGVDNDWQTKHSSTLEADLGQLAQQWKQDEVIIIQGLTPTTTPAWYLVSAGKVVTATSITWSDDPRWLGTDINGTTGYFYLVSSGQIYSIAVGGQPQAEINVLMAVRSDDLLVLINPQNDYTLMTLRNVRYAMMSQVGASGTVYSIPSVSWRFYTDVVEWKNPGTVQVGYENDTGALQVKKIKDDLVFVDPATNNSLTIRKAFGTDSAYSGISIKFTSPNITITPSDIEGAQAWLQSQENLSSPPDIILLRNVFHYLQLQKTVGSGISSAGTGVGSVVSSAGNALGSGVSSVGNDAGSVISSTGAGDLGSGVSSAGNALGSGVSSAGNDVGSVASSAGAGVSSVAGKLGL